MNKKILVIGTNYIASAIAHELSTFISEVALAELTSTVSVVPKTSRVIPIQFPLSALHAVITNMAPTHIIVVALLRGVIELFSRSAKVIYVAVCPSTLSREVNRGLVAQINRQIYEITRRGGMVLRTGIIPTSFRIGGIEYKNDLIMLLGHRVDDYTYAVTAFSTLMHRLLPALHPLCFVNGVFDVMDPGAWSMDDLLRARNGENVDVPPRVYAAGALTALFGEEALARRSDLYADLRSVRDL